MKSISIDFPTVSLLLLLWAGLCHSQVITPTGATSTSTIGSNGRTITAAVDGSGLSNDANFLDKDHSPTVNAQYWLSASGAVTAGNEELVFRFASASDVAAVHIWNYYNGNTDWNTRGLKSFDLSFSSDPTSTAFGSVTFGTPIALPTDIAIGSLNGDGRVDVQTVAFATQSNVTFVKLSNLVSHRAVENPPANTDFFGLNEIRFGGPGTGPAMALGDPDVTVLDYDQAEATSFLSGEDASTVILYWGTVDQGESQTGWDASAPLGAQTAGAAIPVPAALMASLTQGTTYRCRFYAQSASSPATAWSNSASFTTPNAMLLTNPETTYLAYDEADVTVTSNRDTDTTQLYWGTTDPGATATGWDHGPVELGAQAAGTFPAETLSGLTEFTTYYFRYYCESSSPAASTAWSDAGSFKTPLENPPTIIEPTAVTATDSVAAYPVIHTIDSSGLHNSAASPLDWTHDPTPPNTNDKSWLGARAGTEIIYELPEASTLTALYFWSYWGGVATRSLTAFDISFSSNGVDYSASSTITPGTPGSAAEFFDLGVRENVTHIKFDNLQNGGDNLAGIGEVRFGGGAFVATDRFKLTITPNGSNPGNYDFTWAGLDNKLYDLVSSTDLSTPVTSWPVWEGNVDIAGAAPLNTLANVAGGADPRRFFGVIEKDPPPLFSADFETGDGGFTSVNKGTGTVWSYGSPNSPDQGGGAVTSGNGGSANCWGTDIGNPGVYASGTDTSLISPVIDLTGVAGATLSFAQAIDIFAGDTLVVNVLDDTTDTVLEAAVHTSTPDPEISSANWETVSSITITGGEPVRIEWRFTGNGDGTYIGAYIDDVVVTIP